MPVLRSRHRAPPIAQPPGESSGTPQQPSKRPRFLTPPPAHVFQRLLDRQLDAAMQRNFVKRSARERFSHLTQRLSFDLYSMEHAPPGLNILAHQRYRVTELCAAEDMAFGLTENGVCAAYCIRSGRQLCLLNTEPSEVIRSLFHNKTNRTLITVSVYAHDQYSCLRCRETKLEHLKRGVTDEAVALFESESLRWPGFVEFDDVNGKVLTFSADRSTYKVWSMAEPSTILYQFEEASLPEGIEEIKISPGIMLLISKYDQQYADHIPLRILSIETGETLRDIKQPIRKGKKLDVIEQFNERLLLKQEGSPLLIVDLLSSTCLKVTHPFFQTPSAFIFLYENNTFLAFKGSTVTVWNFKGELIANFDDHRLCFPTPDIDHTSVIYITQSQDIIISLCEDRPPTTAANPSQQQQQQQQAATPQQQPSSSQPPPSEAAAAAVLPPPEIIHYRTADGNDAFVAAEPQQAAAAGSSGGGDGGGGGEHDGDGDGEDDGGGGGGGGGAPPAGVSIHVSNVHTGKLLARIDQRALHDHSNVTALCYSEETGDIITGNEQGFISVWSN